MRILALDIGTGTQDVLLFDPEAELENALRLVMPSPTRILADRIRAATRRREPVVLAGPIMGGGPSSWAVEDHLRAGLPVYATPEAARTLNDDLEEVARLGVRIVAEEEVDRLPGTHLRTGDLDWEALRQAFGAFGVDLDRAAEGVAVAVFDHGAAPPGVSDRIFRLGILEDRLRARNHPAALAFRREEIPPELTRLRAAAAAVPGDRPVVAMDTAFAALLGALEDPRVRARDGEGLLLVNLGNFHTLAFRWQGGRIQGLLEHHTGLLDRPKLEGYLVRLAAADLPHEEVFADHAHGVLELGPGTVPPERPAVLGPRRGLLAGSRLGPVWLSPHGEMMLAGCFGLLRAAADRIPEAREGVDRRLGPGGAG